MRPRIIIASASKNIRVARALQKALGTEFRPTVWDQGVFSPSAYVLPEFLKKTRESDFAIAVCGPDETQTRGKDFVLVPNANVLVEFGIFLGVLGLQRSFLALASPSSVKVELPSDLFGLTWTSYDASRLDENIEAAVGTAAHDIREAITTRFRPEEQQRALADVRVFEDFHDEFKRLIGTCKRLEVCFVHSRRWRENHSDMLSKRIPSGEIAEVVFYLPDIRNQEFVEWLTKRFSDGQSLPAYIFDSIKWTLALTEVIGANASFYLYDRLSSYTFYRFDDSGILALYANATIKKQVPAIFAPEGSREWDFLARDISDFRNECAQITHADLTTELVSFGRRIGLKV